MDHFCGARVEHSRYRTYVMGIISPKQPGSSEWSVKRLPNGDFEIVYDKQLEEEMEAEFARRIKATQNGETGDIVRGK